MSGLLGTPLSPDFNSYLLEEMLLCKDLGWETCSERGNLKKNLNSVLSQQKPWASHMQLSHCFQNLHEDGWFSQSSYKGELNLAGIVLYTGPQISVDSLRTVLVLWIIL